MKRFRTITEADARLLEDGATVAVPADGRISARAAALLDEKHVTIVREGTVAVNPTAASDVRCCPFCAEPIQAAAIVCRYCGRPLGGSALSTSPRAHAKVSGLRVELMVLGLFGLVPLTLLFGLFGFLFGLVFVILVAVAT